MDVNELSRDEKFLKEIDAHIESNLENEQFGVDSLADLMSTSRVQLYRRIEQLTGKNVSQYIREYRLKRAMELLEKDVATVSEIAYRVGFSSPAYFNKCFHAYFGYPPGQVKEVKPFSGGPDTSGDAELITGKVSEAHRPESKYSTQGRKKTLFILPGAIIILFGIGYFIFNNKNPEIFSPDSLSVPSREKSIAILPFNDDSPEKDNEYFCNGMMEEILTHLYNIADMRVISRTDVMRYWDADKGLTVPFSKLRVAYVVEGSVRKSGEDLRITVQLIQVKTGGHLWVETYNGKYTDKLFEFQSNIAQKIAYSMNAVITNPEKHRIERVRKSDIAAYDYILKAKEISRKFWETHEISYISSVHLFADKALEIDPNSPLANLLKGQAFSMEGFKLGGSLARKKYDSANFYAERALKLDPNLFEANLLKAKTSAKEGEFIEFYSRAIKLYPNNLQLLSGLSNHHLLLKTEEDILKGLRYKRRVIELSDEDSPDVFYLKFEYYFFQEKYPEVIKYSLKAMDHGITHPSFHFLAQSLSDQGKFAETIHFLDTINTGPLDGYCHSLYFRAYLELNDFAMAEKHFKLLLDGSYEIYPIDSIRLGYIYLKTGRELMGISILNSMKEKRIQYLANHKKFIPMLELIHIYSILNEKEEALKYLSELERSYVLIGFMDRIGPNKFVGNIIEEPEFREIMSRADKKKKKLQEQFVDLDEP